MTGPIDASSSHPEQDPFVEKKRLITNGIQAVTGIMRFKGGDPLLPSSQREGIDYIPFARFPNPANPEQFVGIDLHASNMWTEVTPEGKIPLGLVADFNPDVMIQYYGEKTGAANILELMSPDKISKLFQTINSTDNPEVHEQAFADAGFSELSAAYAKENEAELIELILKDLVQASQRVTSVPQF